MLDVPLKERLKRTKQKLVTLIPRADIKDYEIRSCLNPILQELIKLGSYGSEIKVNGNRIPIKIIVAKITGDSLGIFEILGLCRNWKGRICRICKATMEEIQGDPSSIGS